MTGIHTLSEAPIPVRGRGEARAERVLRRRKIAGGCMVNENELLYLVLSIILMLIVTYVIARTAPRHHRNEK